MKRAQKREKRHRGEKSENVRTRREVSFEGHEGNWMGIESVLEVRGGRKTEGERFI